jgi:hypothetical protein
LSPLRLFQPPQRLADLSFLIWFGVCAIGPDMVGAHARNKWMLSNLMAAALMVNTETRMS